MNNQIFNVPPQHQKNVQTLMQMFHIPTEEAYHYLQSFGFHLQTAINQRFDQPSHHYNQTYPLPNFVNHNGVNPLIDLPIKQERVVTQMKRKNQLESQRKKYQKTYIIKKILKGKRRRGYGKKADPINLQSQSKEKIEEQFSFKNSLDKLVQGQVHVTFQQQVSQTFELLWKQKLKLVALHCIKFQEASQIMTPFKELLQFTKVVYQTPLYVETFNKQFINFGLDPTKFDFNHYQFFKEFVSESDSFSIILLRYSQKSQKIQIFKKLPFSQTFKLSSPQQFLHLSKFIKQQYRTLLYNQRQKEEMSEEQKKKLIEDRKLKQQQQELYFKQLSAQINSIEQPVVPVQQKDLSQIRRNNRSLLPIYSQGAQNSISLKVRLPNSQFLHFHLPKQETLQYVFKWIENSQQNQLGFEDQVNRKFDIILPLQRISLIERKLQKLCEIFGDSDMQTLAVKEL